MIRLSRFARSEDGAALVEFALLLPTFLLFLGISIEGARTFWSYQTTITGVRDAARYLGRAVPQDICASGGSVTGWNDRLTDIVRNTRTGDTLFPSAVSIDSVTATLDCAAGSYRNGAVPVATITAILRIDTPFSGLFRLAGLNFDGIDTVVSDRTRIIGA
ncbi:TadE/TadG family type IV pilus assembly protein [Thalassococcus sp. BH17M4-6]|uniref:TadE/TadG family type IV pilus assembly protein n=1 Tax=Thalassococcus sp. BH17M4-6 TaxID=3413148 RepID=UPI003BDBB451